MRVLILTQYYPPEPAFKCQDLVRGLIARGHEVQVITGYPCYPDGQIYEGVRQRLYEESYHQDALLSRVPQLPDHSRSAVRRALYYLSFACSAATIGLWRARRADVMLVYQSACPIGLAAWIISRLKRMPYVLDVVDLWPESVAASGMLKSRFAMWLIRRTMKFIYRGAERINVITRGYWNNLRRLGVAEEKLSLIHCWPNDGQFDPVPYNEDLAQTEGLAGRFNVMFVGTIGPVQELRTVIEAAELLRDQTAVQFVMVGDGVELNDLMRLAAERGIDNVRFLGRRSAEEVQQLFPMAGALLVHLKPDPMSSISIPSKTFAYMASGRPILMAVEGEASELVEHHRCGITATPSDPNALADAVRCLVAMPAAKRDELGHAGLGAYRTNYHSQLQICKFDALLRDAAGEPQTSRFLRAA